jgi:lambda repressor-like predicted transcriptional regulator
MSNLTKAKAAMEAANNSSFAYNPFSSIQSGLTPSRTNMQDICKEIKAERKRQGMSQRALAAKSGYSQGTITRAETRMWISMNCLFAIANGLGKKISLI